MSPQPFGTPPDESAPPPREASDAELLRAIASGSEPAFEELRSRYRRAVARVCRAVAGSEEDCDQEVFARVWGKAALFDPTRGSAAAWLLTLARRTALNQLAARPPATPFDREPLGAVEPAVVDAVWLETALQRLTEQERTVIELAYYSDLSESAIAKRLRVPLGSVKSRKRRGLNRLASMLEEEAP